MVNDWHVRSDGEEFEVEELLDTDEEFTSNTPQFLVEIWRGRIGFEELKTFYVEEDALNFARKNARKTGGRFRVLKAPEGKYFNRVPQFN